VQSIHIEHDTPVEVDDSVFVWHDNYTPSGTKLNTKIKPKVSAAKQPSKVVTRVGSKEKAKKPASKTSAASSTSSSSNEKLVMGRNPKQNKQSRERMTAGKKRTVKERPTGSRGKVSNSKTKEAWRSKAMARANDHSSALIASGQWITFAY